MNLTGGLAVQLIPMALVCGLTLAGVVVSFLALWRAQALLRAAGKSAGDVKPSHESAVAVLQRELEALQKEMRETRRNAPAAAISGAPRAGLNLDKRSQALRLHRRGEAPAQIAAMLEIPLQELELLLKVHRIVLRSI
jgi:hypothetical protein